MLKTQIWCSRRSICRRGFSNNWGANPFIPNENPFATAEVLETNTDEQGNGGSGRADIWDKIEGKPAAKMLDREALNLFENNIQKVDRKVCTIKYNGAIAKLTAKGIMFLAGGNTPLFFQDAASFAKFVNTPGTIDANDDDLGMPRIQSFSNTFLPAGRESDDITCCPNYGEKPHRL